MAAQKRHAFGLQITDAIVKAAAVTKTADGYMLSAYGQQPLAGGLIDQGLILNPKGVAEAVRHIYDHPAWGAFTTNQVVCSIPESRVFLKTITIPLYKGKDLSEMILWEAQSIVPIPKEKAYYFWQVLEERSGKVEVLICAAEKNQVDHLVEVAQFAGLVPVAFDLECYATTRTIAPQMLQGRTVLQVHIGLVSTTLTVVANGNIWFNSVLKIATRDFIREIAEVKQIPFAQAESDFYRLGLTHLTSERTLKELANGITAAVNFHNSRAETEADKITQIFLSGSNATIPGLAAKFSQSLSFDVKIAPPRFSLIIPTSGQKMSPLLTVIGSAVRAIEDERNHEMNLLPEYIVSQLANIVVRTTVSRLLWGFGYIYALAFFVLLAMVVVLGENKLRIASEVNSQQAANEKRTTKQLYPWVAKTNKLLTRIVTLDAGHENAAIVLDKISQIIPSTIVLKSIVYDAKDMSWVLAGVATDRIEVLVLEDQLKKMEGVDKIVLPLKSLSEEKNTKFSISFSLKHETPKK